MRRSGHGNAFLASAIPLARSLHAEVSSLGQKIEDVAISQENWQYTSSKQLRSRSLCDEDLQKLIFEMKNLLVRIDREVPLLQLAVTASGESLSTSVPPSVSPSRLLQASTLLIIGDTHHAQNPTEPAQIGPSFGLTLYMLFRGHAVTPCSPMVVPRTPDTRGAGRDHAANTAKPVYGLGEGERKPLWKEVLYKARLRLCRAAVSDRKIEKAESATSNELPPAPSYSYYLEIIEDLDDGRAHEESECIGEYKGVRNAGTRELVPIFQISKLFYTDTGRLLNIGDPSSSDSRPVLLVKRDTGASRKKAEGAQSTLVQPVPVPDEIEDEQTDVDRQLTGECLQSECSVNKAQSECGQKGSNLSPALDPEWLAFEVFEESALEEDEPSDAEDSESNPDLATKQPRVPYLGGGSEGLDHSTVDQLRHLSLQARSESNALSPSILVSCDSALGPKNNEEFLARSPLRSVTKSLSLLEMLIRLAGLQEVQQTSHLAIPDHVLSFFLEETSTTGLVGEQRLRARNETKQRVGFDPYMDSP